MKPDRFARLKKILLEASDLPEEKRKAYLDQACDDDPDLRLETEAILANDDDLSAILQQAGDMPTTAVYPDSVTQPIPTKIAGYRIKRIIGQGGMGMVYEAEQEKPRRTVALKVMRTGIASANTLKRFEYESQLLARLTHPGIAQVYEAGTHDDGIGPVPYFAMEYVPDARSIIDYAEEKKLGTRERLELFAQVCDAVHHGHQKGIIHRDLKPGNILVNPEGRVKIIDFGVARSTDSDMALTTLQTDVGQLIGTLQYMSPEQCAADPKDIDTRSDVYALGVVQYELLCGQLPYDVRKKAFHEVTRVIREEPPTRPSSIRKQLRGDVETIVLKALDKVPERRYQGVAALAEDLDRYLTCLPIMARPPSSAYQLRKLVARHKFVFGSLFIILLVLAGALKVSLYLLKQSEEATMDAMIISDQSRLPIAAMNLRGKNRYREAESLYLVLLKVNLNELGEEHQKTLVTMSNLAELYVSTGRHDDAESLYDRAIEIKKRTLGEQHLSSLSTMSSLALLYISQGRHDEADELLTQIVASAQNTLPDNDWRAGTFQLNYGRCLVEMERFSEAESALLDAQDSLSPRQGKEHAEWADTVEELVQLYMAWGKPDEAAQWRAQLPEPGTETE